MEIETQKAARRNWQRDDNNVCGMNHRHTRDNEHVLSNEENGEEEEELIEAGHHVA